MKIAINGRFLLPRLEGIGHYTFELIDHLSNLHPEDEYYIILDRHVDFEIFRRKNIHHFVLSPPTRHPLLWYLWFEQALPRLFKKIKPDVFFSPDGFLSLKINVPTLLTIHDLAYLHYPQGSKFLHRIFLQHYLPKYIHKAKAISCVSGFSKNDLVSHFPSCENKADIIYNGVSASFRPLSKSEVKSCRDRISDGRPYFLFLGSIHPRKNVARLIKAFSEYKKIQRDDLVLVLAGRMAWKSNHVQKIIFQSDVKDSIIFVDTLQEYIPEIVGAAYAMCYPSLFEGFGLPVIEAMATGVPTITSSKSAMEEVCGKGALYVNPKSIPSITEGLFKISNDENLKKSLIEKGIEQAKQYRWENAAEKIYDLILSIAKSS